MFKHRTSIIFLVVALSLQQISVTQAKNPSEYFEELKMYKSVLSLIPGYGQVAVAIWEFFEAFATRLDPKTPPDDTKERLTMLQNNVDTLTQEFRTMKDDFREQATFHMQLITLNDKITDIAEKITSINTKYDNFQRIISGDPDSQAYYAHQLAHIILEKVEEDLDQLYNVLFQSIVTIQNVFYLMSHPDLARGLMCLRYQSAQQNLYNFYQLILQTESRGYILLQFAYDLEDRMHTKSQNTTMPELEKKLKNQLLNIYRQVYIAIKSTGREMWRCGGKLKEGTQFVRLNPAFQKIILYAKEKTLSGVCKSSVCTQGDGWTKHLRSTWGLNKQCESMLFDCKLTKEELTVCKAEKTSSRIYDWIKSNKDGIYGHDSNCEGRQKDFEGYPEFVPFRISKIPNINMVSAECELCLCTCDNRMVGDKRVFFDLNPITSDFNNNKIITGVKIAVENPSYSRSAQIFRFEILEEKLLSHGLVNVSTHVPRKNEKLYEDQYLNLHQIHWERRTICLDILNYQGNDRVLTGVRFENEGGELQVAIGMTSFDGKTGELNPKDTKWYNQQNLPGAAKRSKLDLKNLKFPNHEGSNNDLSKSGQCINFELSSMKDDAGQTVVPFIDIQTLKTYPPAPLTGFGLYLRGEKGTAGYVAPKLITYDYSSQMEERPKLHMGENAK